ncbi:hypothetical protein Pmar_PMAR029074 [Perkinsus marinus ATCC 50983]|uniref:USP domain-containing protein n=1 Tax=Perkinsus marinus (strain ATCC 50983 / TXsc) TaxID=423536 RepID=C5KNV9_PERM5|nr:hypothetical protein Pmar_PMAR029074 [Perkinsus marinus ATCC 50983]EER13834.1 hypothetical protein Pmar_PMAR029074 [Perkinsus marinus ATCC 50983]|eukprot:XP_002782039.1 hypothetical protein Pmar_PMAR029074 [Perkinsus marinus ATCC 50983]
MVDLGELGEPPVKVPRVVDVIPRESASKPGGVTEEDEDAVSFSSECSVEEDDDDDSRGGKSVVEPEVPPARAEELEMWVDMCEASNRIPKASLRSMEVKSAGPFSFRLLVYPCGTQDARHGSDYAPSAFVEIVPPEKRGLNSEPGRYFPDRWCLRCVNFCISIINFKADRHGRILLRCAAQALRLGVESQGNRPDYDGPVVPYLGLENLGATCYLNGLLQSLFLIPQFRRIV